jgi:hypothetical protein
VSPKSDLEKAFGKRVITSNSVIIEMIEAMFRPQGVAEPPNASCGDRLSGQAA